MPCGWPAAGAVGSGESLVAACPVMLPGGDIGRHLCFRRGEPGPLPVLFVFQDHVLAGMVTAPKESTSRIPGEVSPRDEVRGGRKKGDYPPPLGVKVIQLMFVKSVGNVSFSRGVPAGRVSAKFVMAWPSRSWSRLSIWSARTFRL